MPLGLIGIGLGTVLLPTISHQLGSGADAEAMRTQNRGLELALFFTLPATVALAICGAPIITGLFQHGQFGAADAVKTGQALAAFSLGLPAYILVKVLTPGYYARHDTKTPMRYAMISIAINLVLNLALDHSLEACRTAACDRGRFDRQRLDALSHAEEARPFRERRAARRKVPRLAIAASSWGSRSISSRRWSRPISADPSPPRRRRSCLVTAGFAVYAIACFVTGAFVIDDIKLLKKQAQK